MNSEIEHAMFAVERVAAQPCQFTARQAQGGDVVELFTQYRFVDHVC